MKKIGPRIRCASTMAKHKILNSKTKNSILPLKLKSPKMIRNKVKLEKKNPISYKRILQIVNLHRDGECFIIIN